MRRDIDIAVMRDDFNGKEFSVTSGDKTWWIIIERDMANPYPPLWTWDFLPRTRSSRNASSWSCPNWETALQEALDYIT